MSVFLWRYWTPRCNEAYPVWVGLSMYATLLAIPLITIAAVTLRRTEQRSRQTIARFLLDARWHLLDSALLGAAYGTGRFGVLQLEPPDRVRFRFICDTEWTPDLLPRRGFRPPFVRDATDVSRKLGFSRHFSFSRHFIVRGQPLPATRQAQHWRTCGRCPW